MINFWCALNWEIYGISLYSIRVWENTDQKNSNYGQFSRITVFIQNLKKDFTHYLNNLVINLEMTQKVLS